MSFKAKLLATTTILLSQPLESESLRPNNIFLYLPTPTLLSPEDTIIIFSSFPKSPNPFCPNTTRIAFLCSETDGMLGLALTPYYTNILSSRSV